MPLDPNFQVPTLPTPLQEQAQSLAQQQQWADILRQQGLEQPQGIQAGGFYIAPSPTQHLARLASMLMAGRTQGQVNQGQLALAQQYQQMRGRALAQALGGGGPMALANSGIPDLQQAAMPAIVEGMRAGMWGIPTPGMGAGAAPIAPPGVAGAAPESEGAVSAAPSVAQPGQPPGPSPQAAGFGPRNFDEAMRWATSGLPGPTKAAELWAARNAPTDTQKDLASAGITPQTPGYGQLVLRKLFPLVNQRAGGVARDPLTGQVIGTAPAAPPAGYINVADPNDPSGFRTVPMGGGPGAVLASTGTTAQGHTLGTPSPGYGPGGGPGYAPPNPYLMNLIGPNAPQPSGVPGGGFNRAPAPSGAPGAPISAPPTTQSDPWSAIPKMPAPAGFGQTTYQRKTDELAAEQASELTKKYGAQANEANQRLSRITQASSLVDQSTTGAGAATIADVKNLLVTRFGVPESDFAEGPSATQALQKDLVGLATQKAKQMFGSRISTAEVQLMLTRGSPNVDMTKAAMHYLLDTDAQDAKYQIQQANDVGRYLSSGGDPYRFEGWYAQHFPQSAAVAEAHLNAGSKPAPQPMAPALPLGKEVQATKVLNGKTYQKINGQWFER
jgi:hypothetical protein